MDISTLSKLATSSEAIGTIVAALTATAGAIVTLYKSTKLLLEFNDEYLQKRRLKRLSFLSKEAEDAPKLKQLLTSAKHEEVFRTVFGKVASAQMSDAVIAIHSSGRFSVEELRASSRYWKLRPDGSLQTNPGASGTFTFWVATLCLSLLLIYFTYAISRLLAVETPGAIGLAIGFLAIFFCLFVFCMLQIRAVYFARRITNELRESKPTSGHCTEPIAE